MHMGTICNMQGPGGPRSLLGPTGGPELAFLNQETKNGKISTCREKAENTELRRSEKLTLTTTNEQRKPTTKQRVPNRGTPGWPNGHLFRNGGPDGPQHANFPRGANTGTPERPTCIGGQYTDGANGRQGYEVIRPTRRDIPHGIPKPSPDGRGLQYGVATARGGIVIAKATTSDLSGAVGVHGPMRRTAPIRVQHMR